MRKDRKHHMNYNLFSFISFCAVMERGKKKKSVPVVLQMSPDAPPHSESPLLWWMSNRSVTHPGRVLLHLMLVAVRAAGVATPEAVLAELVTAATEAAIAEARHAVAPTVRAWYGMIDWERGTKKAWDWERESTLYSGFYFHIISYYHNKIHFTSKTWLYKECTISKGTIKT